MELSTAQALTALNQRFYADHAENFADARPRLPSGVQRVLSGIAPSARVLEAGCGDGKVGRALARAGIGTYVGLDSSEAMLERAQRYTRGEERYKWDEGRSTNGEPTTSVLHPPSFLFLLSDLTSLSWSSALPSRPFDWILAFAVFHHLPGYMLRLEVLRALAQHLAPAGRLALSNWQFTRSERLKKRIVPWAQAGLTEADVEPGDYLLSWERKGTRGLRYVHLLGRAELQRLAVESGLRVVEDFSTDGVTGDLSDYVLMGHNPPALP